MENRDQWKKKQKIQLLWFQKFTLNWTFFFATFPKIKNKFLKYVIYFAKTQSQHNVRSIDVKLYYLRWIIILFYQFTYIQSVLKWNASIKNKETQLLTLTIWSHFGYKLMLSAKPIYRAQFQTRSIIGFTEMLWTGNKQNTLP